VVIFARKHPEVILALKKLKKQENNTENDVDYEKAIKRKVLA